MNVRPATSEDASCIISFFKENLTLDDNAIYSDEFICSMGVRSAIKRQQIIIAVEDEKVVGALRYYRRKKIKLTSLYQFAVSMPYRGRRILLDMLELIRETDILVLCPKTAKLNSYYAKTGWTCKDSDSEYNFWVLPKKDR